MKFKRWIIPQSGTDAALTLMDAGYPRLVSAVLAGRGVHTAEEAAAFLEEEQRLPHAPLLMKDMDKAVERVSQAITRGERIAVFGDYDVDGITATCLLTDYLQGRGANVVRYIPRRIEDGYGLGKEPIRSLAAQGVSLIVTVDCGITGVEETAFAKTLGVDLVITDHHECKDELPDAVAVVDPHRPDCPYPFKQLAGVGVALKLVLALGGKDREDALFARYCTLAAIGTVADVMRMHDENRTIVRRGLENIAHTDFLGLNALLREIGLADKSVSSTQIGFVLAPRINAAGRMGAAELAADLLLTDDEAEAEALAHQLCELNRERQSVEQEIFAHALEQIETFASDERSALVLSSREWHQGVVGIVASRLAEKFSCPSFMIHLYDDMGKGSCRSFGTFNLFAALEACSDLLVAFGGHELAAGFTIREENIPAFRKRMNQYVRAHWSKEPPVSSLEVDVAIDRPAFLTLEEADALEMLEPYGAGNSRPVFFLGGATVVSMQSVGQNKHLKLRLSKGQHQFDAIFFSATPETCGVEEGQRVDAAFHLQVNEFRANRTLQLQIIDLRGALAPSGREESALALCAAFTAGATIPARDAVRLLPSREQFVNLWHTLERVVGERTLEDDEMPLLRRLCAAVGGAEPFLRTVFCLHVFAERGLVDIAREGGLLRLRLTARGKKANLDDCPYVRTLHEMLDRPGKGGSYDDNGTI